MNTEEMLRLSLAVVEEHLGVSVYDLTRYAADYWDELLDVYYEPHDSEEENQKRKAHYQQCYEQCQTAFDKLRAVRVILSLPALSSSSAGRGNQSSV